MPVSGVVPRIFTSSPSAITAGGLLTLPHGLGVIPTSVKCEYRCIASDAGYSIGDSVDVIGMDTNGVQAGFSLWADIVNIYVRFASTAPLIILNKTTGVWGAPSLASWNLVIKALAL